MVAVLAAARCWGLKVRCRRLKPLLEASHAPREVVVAVLAAARCWGLKVRCRRLKPLLEASHAPREPGRAAHLPDGTGSAVAAHCRTTIPPGPTGLPRRPGRAAHLPDGTGSAVAAHCRTTIPPGPTGLPRRPPATTVGLALLAAAITLWLGLVAQFGQMITGGSADGRPIRPVGCPTGLPWYGWKRGSPCMTWRSGWRAGRRGAAADRRLRGEPEAVR